ncbi:hypothetical protein ACCO45_008176 [Purpureocillium lilacinum]|uniref:Uncharacterized protein n=1 Tax=Purpureocillium lilacinum TaxID=33203 RepID=A0ACC4DNA0_PURLI
MVVSFPQIRFGLLVGIAGGIPSAQHDIRLGDIVISKPEGILSGVVHLQTQYELGKGRIAQCLQKLFQDEDGSDKLTHEHLDDTATCDSCESEEEVQREERSTSDPVIHYGTIASGNRVVKSAEERDKEGSLLGALCFEMEAAGIMDNFPCLVIRGICDYSDSHKNKRWQRYSAATAAAYAVEFLCHISSHDVRDTPAATEAKTFAPKFPLRLPWKLRRTSHWL